MIKRIRRLAAGYAVACGGRRRSARLTASPTMRSATSIGDSPGRRCAANWALAWSAVPPLRLNDLADERRRGHDGVGAVFLEQGETGTLGAGNGLHRAAGDPGQQLFQAQLGRPQARETVQAGLKIIRVSMDSSSKGPPRPSNLKQIEPLLRAVVGVAACQGWIPLVG